MNIMEDELDILLVDFKYQDEYISSVINVLRTNVKSLKLPIPKSQPFKVKPALRVIPSSIPTIHRLRTDIILVVPKPTSLILRV